MKLIDEKSVAALSSLVGDAIMSAAVPSSPQAASRRGISWIELTLGSDRLVMISPMTVDIGRVEELGVEVRIVSAFFRPKTWTKKKLVEISVEELVFESCGKAIAAARFVAGDRPVAQSVVFSFWGGKNFLISHNCAIPMTLLVSAAQAQTKESSR